MAVIVGIAIGCLAANLVFRGLLVLFDSDLVEGALDDLIAAAIVFVLFGVGGVAITAFIMTH